MNNRTDQSTMKPTYCVYVVVRANIYHLRVDIS